jgi:hypothetical protein
MVFKYELQNELQKWLEFMKIVKIFNSSKPYITNHLYQFRNALYLTNWSESAILQSIWLHAYNEVELHLSQKHKVGDIILSTEKKRDKQQTLVDKQINHC